MASMGDYLDKMVVSVMSPDRNIRARVSNGTEVEVDFQPGTFNRYDEERLGHQLARLGVTTWVAYQRGRDEAYKRALGLSATEVPEPGSDGDPRRARYQDALLQLECEGVSAGRAMRIDTRGMARWTVRVEPGAIRRLGQERFLAEIHSAIGALLSDRAMKTALLRSEHFDMGIPQRWRDLMARQQAAGRRGQ